MGFTDGSVVKNLPAMQETACHGGDAGSIPVLGRSPGTGNGNPFQCSCLEKSMDRRAWWATVHELKESDMTESTHTHKQYPNSRDA